MAYAVGIDLGTTFSAAAVSGNGWVEVFSLGNRSATIPSIVYLREDGQVLIGEAAERRAFAEPWRAAREFKRRLGDPTPIVLGGTPHSTESLLARVYEAIVRVVASRRGEAPASIVITHPAYYGPYKLDLLGEAVRMAGVENAQFIAEPVAAAAHYAAQERVEPGKLIGVYDFGGGTFDAAVLRKTDNDFEVVGTPEGLAHLGGIDFDEAVFAHVRRQLGGKLEQLDTNEPAVLAALVRLRSECTAAKEALSVDTDTDIPVLLPGVQTTVPLSRREFEAMIRPRLGETVSALERAVASAGISMAHLDRVLLVGGSSRIPLVRQTVADSTQRPVAVDVDPKFSVALGAALAGLRGPVGSNGARPAVGGVLTVPPSDSRPTVQSTPTAAAHPQQPGTSPQAPVLAKAEPAASPAPAGEPPRDPRPRTPDESARRRWQIAGAALVVALVVLGVGLLLAAGDGQKKDEVAKTEDSTPAPTTRGAPPVTRVPAAPEWRAARDAPTARQQLPAVEAFGTVWLFGGLTDTGATAKVEGYDAAIDTWKSGPDLPLPLHHEMAVNYKGEPVVLGGWAPVGPNLTAVISDRVFALRGGNWTELPRLLRPRASGTAAVVGDRIVVVGGQADGKLVTTTEVFDGLSWREVAPIPTPRDHPAGVSDGHHVYVAGGRALSADKNSAAFERYDPATDRWEQLPELPTARGGLGAAIVGHRIVALGGEHPTGVFATVEAFDLDLGSWTKLPPMPTPRHGIAVVAVGSSVYALGGGAAPTHARSTPTNEVLDLSATSVIARSWRAVRDAPTARQQLPGAEAFGTVWLFGGLTDTGATTKVEGYDPAIDTWKSGPDLPLPLHHQMAVNYKGELVVLGGWVPDGSNLSAIASDRVFVLRGGTWTELPRLLRPRASGAAAVVGDNIVVLGGQADGKLVNTSEVFDGSAWREVAPMPTPRDHLAAVADGRHVYALGGRALSADKNTAAFERYDPATDRWEKLPDAPTARGGLGAALVGRRIAAIGGEQPTGVFDTVEAFDLDLGVWTTLPPMRTPRHGVAVVSVGSSVYAVGGAAQASHARSTATNEVIEFA